MTPWQKSSCVWRTTRSGKPLSPGETQPDDDDNDKDDDDDDDDEDEDEDDDDDINGSPAMHCCCPR